MSTIIDDCKMYKSYQDKLILEFNEATIKKLLLKFKKENPDLPDENIQTYLEAYEQLKNTPRFALATQRFFPEITNPKDIFSFSWVQLEQVIDSLREIEIKTNIVKDVSKYKVTYEDDNIMIVLGRDPEEWMYIRDTILPTLPPYKGATWCIGNPGGAAYYTYRKHTGVNFSIYLIHSKQPTPSPRYQNSVLMTSEKGNYRLTSQNNDDGDPIYDWGRVVHLIPALKNKQQYVPFLPFSKKEDQEYAIINSVPKDFFRFRYNTKKIYCQMGKKIFKQDFLNSDKDIQTIYINGQFDRGGYCIYNTDNNHDWRTNVLFMPTTADGDRKVKDNVLIGLLGYTTPEERNEIYKGFILSREPDLQKLPGILQTFCKQCEKHLPTTKSRLLYNTIENYTPTTFKDLPDRVKYTLCEVPNIIITRDDFLNIPEKLQENYINSRTSLRHLVYMFFTRAMQREFDAENVKNNINDMLQKVWKNNSVKYRQVIDEASKQGEKGKGVGITYLLNFNGIPASIGVRKLYTSKILEKIKQENE